MQYVFVSLFICFKLLNFLFSCSCDDCSLFDFLLLGSDVAEVDRLHCQKKDLEKFINTIEESLKIRQTELRRLEDEAANYETQRVNRARGQPFDLYIAKPLISTLD